MTTRRISLRRFDILSGYTRLPSALLVSDELEHYATEDDRVLGVLVQDRIDGDFAGLVIGRDESRQYRCVEVNRFTESLEAARVGLLDLIAAWNLRPDADFYQGEPVKPFLDVFLPVVDVELLNPSFLTVATAETFTPARRVIERMMPFFQDIDGNFIQQFQTHAFDARIWELYLFAALTELKVTFDRRFTAPDYLCDFFGYKFFVEATTVNPTIKNGVVVEPDPSSMPPDQLKSYFLDYMPIKWGSALSSKLAKKYWELPHTAEAPIVFAVQDFHIPHSMSFSSGTLAPYLYGLQFNALYDASGNLVVSNELREGHTWGDKTIPSGFFTLPGAEHVSAVISNPLGTVSKFNRMGVGAGFGMPDVRMLFTGTMHDHDPNAVAPKRFAQIVTAERWDEPWCGGLNVFHNPNALQPLEPAIFQGYAQHFYEDGQLRSLLPDFHPYGARCISVKPDRLGAD